MCIWQFLCSSLGGGTTCIPSNAWDSVLKWPQPFVLDYQQESRRLYRDIFQFSAIQCRQINHISTSTFSGRNLLYSYQNRETELNNALSSN